MKVGTITLEEFLKGNWRPKPEKATHAYRAVWRSEILHGGVAVFAANGVEVTGAVRFASTDDRRSVSALIETEGFIGGWQYPHRAMPFRFLVDKINEGVLYSHAMLLPKSSEPAKYLLGYYRRLHEGLSDMIESGRLKEADIPDDYQWLVKALVELTILDPEGPNGQGRKG